MIDKPNGRVENTASAASIAQMGKTCYLLHIGLVTILSSQKVYHTEYKRVKS